MDDIDYVLKESDYNHITFNNGEPLELLRFISSAESVYDYACSQNIRQRVSNEEMLLHYLKSQVKGDLEPSITSQNINSVNELLDVLRHFFLRSSSNDMLKLRISYSRPLPYDTPITYLNRLLDLRFMIYCKYKYEGLDKDHVKKCMESVDKKIINHLYCTLPAPLVKQITHFHPTTVDDFSFVLSKKMFLGDMKGLYKSGLRLPLQRTQIYQRNMRSKLNLCLLSKVSFSNHHFSSDIDNNSPQSGRSCNTTLVLRGGEERTFVFDDSSSSSDYSFLYDLPIRSAEPHKFLGQASENNNNNMTNNNTVDEAEMNVEDIQQKMENLAVAQK